MTARADDIIVGREAAVHIMLVLMTSKGVVAAAAKAPAAAPMQKSSCIRYMPTISTSPIALVTLQVPCSCLLHTQVDEAALQGNMLYLHVCSTPIVEAPVEAAHGLVGGKLEGHVGHILKQVGQVACEQAAHASRICDGPCGVEHIGVHTSLHVGDIGALGYFEC